MRLYEIIETDDGLMVAETGPGIGPDQVAAAHGGVLVDPGPYLAFEDAYDAILAMQKDEDEEEEDAQID
jgi:hypothetical protein